MYGLGLLFYFLLFFFAVAARGVMGIGYDNVIPWFDLVGGDSRGKNATITSRMNIISESEEDLTKLNCALAFGRRFSSGN